MFILIIITEFGLTTQIQKLNTTIEPIQNQLTLYRYDDAGNRIRKAVFENPDPEALPIINIDAPSGGWTLVSDEFYVRGADGLELAIYNQTELKQHNVYSGSDNTGKIPVNGDFNYYLKDHLGSIRVIIDQTKKYLMAMDYDAWGYELESRTFQLNEGEYKFTSKERDEESGYDYFGARYYDSRIGRWGSVDPLFEKQFDKNPFVYCSNNPIKYIDPLGLDDIFYKDGVEIKRNESNWLENLFFGHRYFVQHEKGIHEFEGENYFEALSEETVLQFDWNSIVADWSVSNSNDGFNTLLNKGTEDASNSFPENYLFVLKEGQQNKMLDSKQKLNKEFIYIYNGIALNYQQAGNVVFGAAVNKLNLEFNSTILGAHGYAIYSQQRLDEQNEIQAVTIGYYNHNSESFYFESRRTLKYR